MLDKNQSQIYFFEIEVPLDGSIAGLSGGAYIPLSDEGMDAQAKKFQRSPWYGMRRNE